MLLQQGYGDAMICGTTGPAGPHLSEVRRIIGRKKGVQNYFALSAAILPTGTLFITDTYVNYDPTAEQLAEATILSAERVRSFGITPKVGLVCHSNFGSSRSPSAEKMRDVLKRIFEMQPELDVVRRQTGFDEIHRGLDETNALYEARRCLSCGNCFECDNCYGVCPDNAVIKLGPGKHFEFNYDYCKGRGICAAECPCGAIDMVPENI